MSSPPPAPPPFGRTQSRSHSPTDSIDSRRSAFTYKQLAQMASYSTSTPLRVVAHVDLDAFYSQCEMIRLGVDENQPLAVQQWQGLIAINYPARKFGIGRHCNVAEAKKLCPDLICQHVATWKEGDETWAYHEEAAANIATHKVSLDPYRAESRKILGLIKASLPANLQKVEKASIDEVFCDLSAHVRSILLERYSELSQPPPRNDPTERLPLPPLSCLDWQADALVDLDDAEQEADEVDWDDVAMLVGSEIVRGVRARIRRELGYTCSAGIASNKMLSKLGSGHRKPASQTVVRPRAAARFVAGFPLTKIRNLGGKLGDSVVTTFGTEAIDDLLPLTPEQLKAKLGDETGTWLHNTIRGLDWSDVNPRTQIKSMLSAKSFRPVISTRDHAVRWLRIFVADIYSRLVEEGVLENRRRPRTINLHHRHSGQTRSRSAPIPQGRRVLDEKVLFDIAQTLLDHIIAEGNVWPCANLSLSVAGFEDAETGNMGIGNFLVRGEEAKAAAQQQQQLAAIAGSSSSHSKKGNYAASQTTTRGGSSSSSSRAEKRRRLETGGIASFFARKAQEQQQQQQPHHGRDDWDEDDGSDEVTREHDESTEGGEAFLPGGRGRDHQHDRLHHDQPQPGEVRMDGWSGTRGNSAPHLSASSEVLANPTTRNTAGAGAGASYQQSPIAPYLCVSCDAGFDSPEALQSHQDWHFAMELQESEQRQEQQRDAAAPALQFRPAKMALASHKGDNSRSSSGPRKHAAPPSKPGRGGGAAGGPSAGRAKERGQQKLQFS